MNRGIEFHTVTCLNWNHLLTIDKRKEIVANNFEYLVEKRNGTVKTPTISKECEETSRKTRKCCQVRKAT